MRQFQTSTDPDGSHHVGSSQPKEVDPDFAIVDPNGASASG
jgi:hypothetical protein